MESIRKTISAQPHEVQDVVPSSGVPSTSPTLEAIPTTADLPSKEEDKDQPQVLTQGGLRFWLILASLLVSSFLAALDLSSISTALPTIVQDLGGTSSFAWVGNALALGSTAVLPLTGGLAQAFGRRPVVLGSLFFFAVGSALCGAAQSMAMMIAGRTLQGIGAGGIQSMTAVVLSDLVPLSKRGAYQGLISAVWAVASAIGPPVGGAFSQTNWRWLFYLNLPLTAIAATLVWFFLHLKVPRVEFKVKMRRMDWIGNALIMGSTVATVIALTWGGTTHPWSSYQVLVPLILGLVGLVVFFIYEAKIAEEPVVPWALVSNRTGLMGYLMTFFHGLISMAIFCKRKAALKSNRSESANLPEDYLPVYFQGTKGQRPVASGVSVFGNVFTIAPMGIVSGISVLFTGWYKPQTVFAWVLVAVGVGLLSLLDRETSKAEWVGFQIIEGIGLGLLYPITSFPVLAPIPVTQSGYALALWTFVRSYGQMWGITIGAAVLQNGLKKRLPQDFLSLFPKQNIEIAYAVIPMIDGLEESRRIEVQDAFAGSIRVIWLVLVGIAGVGFLSSLVMEQLKLHTAKDEDWGMKEKSGDPEKDPEA